MQLQLFPSYVYLSDECNQKLSQQTLSMNYLHERDSDNEYSAKKQYSHIYILISAEAPIIWWIIWILYIVSNYLLYHKENTFRTAFISESTIFVFVSVHLPPHCNGIYHSHQIFYMNNNHPLLHPFRLQMLFGHFISTLSLVSMEVFST